METQNNDVRVFINGQVKWIPRHLANDPAFCREHGITVPSEPIAVEPYKPQREERQERSESQDLPEGINPPFKATEQPKQTKPRGRKPQK